MRAQDNRSSCSRRFFLAASLVAVQIPAIDAFAGELPEPASYLQGFAEEAIAVLGNDRLPDDERRRQLAVMVDEGFAMERIGKLALGRHWRSTTDKQREAYAGAFREYVIDTYYRRLSGYTGRTLETTGWREAGKRDVMVTSMIHGGSAPFAVDWRLTDGGSGRWLVLDILVEGVSMLVTQRNEFAAIIDRNGRDVSALIDHLRAAQNG